MKYRPKTKLPMMSSASSQCAATAAGAYRSGERFMRGILSCRYRGKLAVTETFMGTRIEKDTFGPIEVPQERLWGAQTQRSLEHFRISGERMPAEVIEALAWVKRGCAAVNR